MYYWYDESRYYYVKLIGFIWCWNIEQVATKKPHVELELKMWYADAKSFFVCEKEMVARGSADGLVRIVGGASQIERPVVHGSRV